MVLVRGTRDSRNLIFKCPSHPRYTGTRMSENHCVTCAVVFLSAANIRLEREVATLKRRLTAQEYI